MAIEVIKVIESLCNRYRLHQSCILTTDILRIHFNTSDKGSLERRKTQITTRGGHLRLDEDTAGTSIVPIARLGIITRLFIHTCTCIDVDGRNYGSSRSSRMEHIHTRAWSLRELALTKFARRASELIRRAAAARNGAKRRGKLRHGAKSLRTLLWRLPWSRNVLGIASPLRKNAERIKITYHLHSSFKMILFAWTVPRISYALPLATAKPKAFLGHHLVKAFLILSSHFPNKGSRENTIPSSNDFSREFLVEIS